MNPHTKRLFIIRHAKSDWSQSLSDFKRPLNRRGENDAPTMGQYLAQHYPTPHHIVSSAAQRTSTTAQHIAKAVQFPQNAIEYTETLYLAHVHEILAVINGFSNDWSSAFLVGHNPGVSDLVYYLCDTPVELKTCCIAVLELQVDDWRAVSQGTCILQTHLSPKALP